MDSLEEPRDRTSERALVALGIALILAATTRLVVPLLVFAALVTVLALPMSGLIAWLSRFDPRPPEGGDDDGPLGGESDLDTAAEDPLDEWASFVDTPAEPLPRPTRPGAPRRTNG